MHNADMEYTADLDLWSTGDFLFNNNASLDTLAPFGGLDAFEDFNSMSELSSYNHSSTPNTPSLTEEESVCASPPRQNSFPPLYSDCDRAPLSAWTQPPQQQQHQAVPPLHYQYMQIQQQMHQLQQQLQIQQYQHYLSTQQEALSRSYTPPASIPLPPTQVKVEYIEPHVDPLLPIQSRGPLLARESPYVKSPLDSYSYNCCKSYDEPLGSMQQLGFPSHPVQFTNLDASHFGTQLDPVKKLRSIPMDISGNLTDAQYYKIFKMYHLQLQLDSHPIMTEEDLEDIKIHGRMYFLKNVKTIVPKIGYWKFHAHLSHRRSDERQYNIPGMAVTCKVREWVTDDGLWRLYHFKKGKTVKAKKLYDI